MEKDISELDLFYQTTETYQTLQQVAKENEIFIEDPVILSPEAGRLKENPYFYHLETYFDERTAPAFIREGKKQINLRETVHTRAELDEVIQEILRLVR